MKFYYIPIILPILILFSCKNSGSQKQEVSNSEQTISIQSQVIPNPEKSSRNTRIPPIFKGQTRVNGMVTDTEYQVNTLTSNLENPWGLINFPKNRFLITSKSGFAYLVAEDGKKISKITGFPEVDKKGQGGLLDIALDPDFEQNNIIYWAFTEPRDKGNHTSIAKGILNENESKIQNAKIIFRATPVYNGRLHYGSRLVIDAQGNILFTTGERSDKVTRPLAQDQTQYLGKIIHIRPDGSSAQQTAVQNGWQPEIYSTGHRNPQGLAIHPETGKIWSSEFGPKGGDEINLIERGKNYGWPIITYGQEYSGEEIGENIGAKDGMEQPVYFWDPSVSPSGIDFYTGEIEEWENNLMVACLSGQKIIRLRIENDKVTGEEWLLADLNERFRDVLNGSDKKLYAITDSGKLIQISKK